MVADGKYCGSLFDVSLFKTDDGRDAASFVFLLEGYEERVSYNLSLVDGRGLKNIYGIQLTLKWADGWNGQDLDWFPAHLEECRGHRVRITVLGGLISWINEAPNAPAELPDPSTSAAGSNRSARKVDVNLIVDPAKIAALPDDLAPNYEEAKTAFDAVTAGTPKKEDADLVWTRLAAKIGPMQIDFGEDEWKQMITSIRNLRSWKGTVEI